MRVERHTHALAKYTNPCPTTNADSTSIALNDLQGCYPCHAFGSYASPMRRIRGHTCVPLVPDSINARRPGRVHTAVTSETLVGPSADSSESILSPLPAISHDAEILDVDDRCLGYDAEHRPDQQTSREMRAMYPAWSIGSCCGNLSRPGKREAQTACTPT
jgi:hypothetical protein